MKSKQQARVGRKPVDHLGSIIGLNEALKATLKRRGDSMPTPRSEINAGFRRSLHFQRKGEPK